MSILNILFEVPIKIKIILFEIYQDIILSNTSIVRNMALSIYNSLLTISISDLLYIFKYPYSCLYIYVSYFSSKKSARGGVARGGLGTVRCPLGEGVPTERRVGESSGGCCKRSLIKSDRNGRRDNRSRFWGRFPPCIFSNRPRRTLHEYIYIYKK